MSGIDFVIIPAMRPVYTSSHEELGRPVILRRQRERPSAFEQTEWHPSDHTIDRGGLTSETLSLNSRSGFTIDVSLILSPSAIEPSMPRTAGFQSGKTAASVNSSQITSGLAAIDLFTE